VVTTVGGPAGDGGRLVLSPRAPISPRGVLILFLSVSSGVLGVAAICGMLGAWQVMPMSLLVVMALGLALFAGYRRTQVDEVVSIHDGTVAIDRHRWRRTTAHYEFQRGWAQVVLDQPRVPMVDPSHLFIRSHGRQVEIGAFLDDAERQELAASLKRLMGPERRFDSCGAG
jgi:uncharacterized membrane protein